MSWLDDLIDEPTAVAESRETLSKDEESRIAALRDKRERLSFAEAHWEDIGRLDLAWGYTEAIKAIDAAIARIETKE